jgi:hypothetical protein
VLPLEINRGNEAEDQESRQGFIVGRALLVEQATRASQRSCPRSGDEISFLPSGVWPSVWPSPLFSWHTSRRLVNIHHKARKTTSLKKKETAKSGRHICCHRLHGHSHKSIREVVPWHFRDTAQIPRAEEAGDTMPPCPEPLQWTAVPSAKSL